MEGPLPPSRVLSLSSFPSLVLCSTNSSNLLCPNFQLHLLNSGTFWVPPRLPFLVSQPENSYKAKTGAFIGFTSYLLCLRNHCSLLFNVQYLESHCFMYFVQLFYVVLHRGVNPTTITPYWL